ncbi:MAG TPA: 4Fe-4S dicluster domain-containing protein [Candidatus Korarchaeota archaeon]|nr:4Fe-4S dicluster domain-containing protein [Candidatus Korarchaeota archaeon]
MSTEGITFRIVAQVLPYITLATLTVGIILRLKRWFVKGNWPIATSSPSRWLPHFVVGVANLLTFSRIYKRRKVFWFLGFCSHVLVFMILFGHLRGFGLWSKEILRKVSPEFEHLMVEVIPPYLGILSTALMACLLVYRVAERNLRLQSGIEDYLVIILVLLTLVSGTLMRLLPPDSLTPLTIEFLPGFVLRLEKTPNLPSLLVHLVTAQLLLMYLSFSKLIHVVTALLTVALHSIERTAEGFVLPRWSEVEVTGGKEGSRSDAAPSILPGRFLLSLESCVTCGNCALYCPTYTSSRERVHIPSVRLRGMLRTHNLAIPKAVDRLALEKMVWECALCGYCSESCPLAIMTDLIYLAVRAELAKVNLIPKPLTELSKVIRETHNPLGRSNDERKGWINFRISKNRRNIRKFGEKAAPLYVELREEDLIKDRAETVYFVGCNASFFKALSGIPDAMVHILKAAGEDFTLLGGEEWCCGYPLLLAGDVEGFREIALHNVEVIRSKGAKRVVFTCAGCYRAFKQFYSRFLGTKLGFEVLHSTQLLYELCAKGKLKPVHPRLRVTYHDPCDIGRHCHIYLEPRKVLESVGCELIEMERAGENSLCCGGGGLLKASNADLSSRISVERARQASMTGAEVLVSACPSCILSLKEGAQAIEGRLKVLDIVEVVASQTGLIPPFK